jgi:hypothetical protein
MSKASTRTKSRKRPLPARGLDGKFLPKAEEARRLQAVVDQPVGTSPPAPKSVTVTDFPPVEEAPVEAALPQLQQLFRQADRTVKRRFLVWLQDYLQLTADQGLREEV